VANRIFELYEETYAEDKQLFERAMRLFPDGVTHDNRHTEPFPIYVERAQGSRKWTVSGKELIDYWSGHGALLLGHNRPEIVKAVMAQVQRGSHYGASHELEIEWGELVRELVPSVERIRFVSSGTEATLMALRLVRTYTGKSKLLKFSGHFHGWHDFVIQDAWAPFGKPVPGVNDDVLGNTVVCPPNDLGAVDDLLSSDSEIGCVIFEPTGAKFGTVPMGREFARGLREVTEKYGVILIFDEVISGFRVAPGGAQSLYDVTPDMSIFAKILAGGFPGGAVGGKADILNLISIRDEAASGRGKRMPHPGTFNANPVSAAAGVAMLKIARTGEPQKRANELAETLRNGLNEVIDRHGLNWAAYGTYSGIRFLLNHDLGNVPAAEFRAEDCDYETLEGSDKTVMKMLRAGLLLNGVDMSGGGGLTTSAHSEQDIQETVAAFEKTIDLMVKEEAVSAAAV
jgi:glutamate-1-semialdehyde 2,1-aminomutase